MLNKCNLIVLPIALLFLLTILSILIGINNFSTDSWSYFELSKTIFSNNFYEFNTYRGYFSDVKSASFPFGYPIILAIVNNVFGFEPINAVYLNIILTVMSIYMLTKILLQLEISYKLVWLLPLSLLIFFPYMDELYSGRSMPFAILLYLSGVYLLVTKKYFFIAGIFFGFTALVRFDYLVFSLLTIIYYSFFYKEHRIKLFAGFLLGIFPWILYSSLFFDSFWISDNSWVSKSSYNVFAGDFPSVVSSTIFTNPIDWTIKVFNNYMAIVFIIFIYIKNSLLTLLGTGFYVYYYRKYMRLKDYTFLLFLLISIGPYATTGYLDARYFTFFYIILGIYTFYSIHNIIEINYKIVYLVFVINFLLVSKWFYSEIKTSMENTNFNTKQLILIEKLHKKQLEDNKIYIFENPRLAARYGALTGGKSAMLPSNFQKLDEITKNMYLKKMEPYKMITKVIDE
jgi:hypothetical protein